MTFYAQIDSIGENYNLADCIIIHQFVCFDCFEVECRPTHSTQNKYQRGISAKKTKK